MIHNVHPFITMITIAGDNNDIVMDSVIIALTRMMITWGMTLNLCYMSNPCPAICQHDRYVIFPGGL